MEIDLHRYHPREIIDTGVLREIVRQAWEMGEASLTLIQGHGRNRGISLGCVNTNTGYFGLRIREALRCDESIRPVRWGAVHPGRLMETLRRISAPLSRIISEWPVISAEL